MSWTHLYCGADISEFGSAPVEPHPSGLIQKLEDFPKPVVAAIHGTALGGGLEIALGCHYRIALSGSQLGLPEVNLGLISGAGGTQRLQRLICIREAVKMATKGQMMTAVRANTLGLINQVVDDDLAKAATQFVKNLRTNKPSKTNELAIDTQEFDEQRFDTTASSLIKRSKAQNLL